MLQQRWMFVLAVALLLGACATPPAVDSSQPGRATLATTSPVENLTVAGRPFFTRALKATTGFSALKLTPQGLILLACVPGQGSSAIGICAIDPAQGTEQLLVAPPTDGDTLSPASGDGDWIVYGWLGTPQRIIAHQRITGEEVEVGRISAGKVDSPVGPAYAIAGSQVVWVDATSGPDQQQTERVQLFDLNTRQTRTLTTLDPGLVIDQIDLDGDTVVWSQVDARDAAATTSNVVAYHLQTTELQPLSTDGRASMPQIAGNTVVWKTTGSRFAYGGIYLFDLTTEQGRTLATASEADGQPKQGFDAPSIGTLGATWTSARNDQIPLFMLADEQTYMLDRSGGRAYTAGHFAVWVSESATGKGEWRILWANLSQPTPQAQVSPQPTPGQPQAATLAPPTTAPSVATPLPTAALPTDIPADWLTYTDPARTYSLRYPPGSTIIRNDATTLVTLTWQLDDTSYTVRVIGPEPIRAGVKQPDETLPEGQGVGNISREAKLFTLNGLPAASRDTSSQSGQPPCTSYTSQAIVIFARPVAYGFDFRVSGPNQCDASVEPVFQHILASFRTPAAP
ncbi:MAG: hypothetical protein MUD01_25625 [Chloroflexaceae bacterium]|jgi:hypothetical protein|nr:hypothetical protein [Chloroflexaceae bacterium]